MVHKGFLRHGMFIEGKPINALARYQYYKAPPSIFARLAGMLPEALRPAPDPLLLIDKFIQAMHDMSVKSVWIQLFNANGALDANGSGATAALVAALKSSGIVPVGWGYCYSENAGRDVELACRLCGTYRLDAFVADVEPGNKVRGRPDTWQLPAFEALIKGLSAKFGAANLGLSTFANMMVHADAVPVMHVAASYVCMFAPQVYWFDKDPVAYMRSSLASWRNSGIAAPLVATVQSYWDTGEGTPAKAVMETKVEMFVSNATKGDYGQLIGLNWYHAGGANSSKCGAMSDPMIGAIAAGQLNDKPYAASA